MILRPEVQVLFWKEIRQLTRSRGAVLSSLFLPVMLLIIAAGVQLLSPRDGGGTSVVAAGSMPGLTDLKDLQEFFLYTTFPVFYVLSGLMTPSLAATYTVVGERERGSLELLMALPVTVGEILMAKLGANLALATATVLPFFAINAGLVLTLGHAGPLYVLGALLLLLSGLAASVGVSLFLALVARDFRTSNNLSGIFVVPAMILTVACVTLVPGLARFIVLAALLLVMAAATVAFCLRWLTFERYLS